MGTLALLLAVAALVVPTWSQDLPDGRRDEIREALHHRLEAISLGDYLIEKAGERPIGGADVAVVLVGLRSPDEKILQSAARAVGVLAGRPFFGELNPAVARHIVECLIDRLGGDGDEAIVSALMATDENAPKWMDAFREQLAGQGLKWVGSSDPELRRRGAILLAALAPRLDEECRARCLGRVLDVLDGPLAAARGGGRARVAEVFMLRAVARLVVDDPALAERSAGIMMQRLGSMTRDPWHLPATVYGGLARHGMRADAAVRERILQRLLADLADESLMYTITSGRRTPLRHPCSDALVTLVPALSDEQVARAIAVFDAARERATTGRWDAEDIESLYGRTLQRLRERAGRGR